MQQHLTLIVCLGCILVTTAKAATTEPNNNKAQASTLALNGSDTGKIALNGNEAWRKVTIMSPGTRRCTKYSSFLKHLCAISISVLMWFKKLQKSTSFLLFF